MKARGYEATFSDLVEVYSDEDIKEQLAYTFWLQIEQVLRDLEVLMWRYKAQATKEVYRREQARHQLVEAWLGTESNNVYTLERSLKYLLGRRQVLVEARVMDAEWSQK